MTLTADSRRRYQQVASAIMESIESAQYKPGERLPSERDLAASFGVSRPTIREAMIALEIRGLAEIRHGSGIYVTDQVPAHAGAGERGFAPGVPGAHHDHIIFFCVVSHDASL